LPRGLLFWFGLEHGAPRLGEDTARFHLFLNSQNELRVFLRRLLCVPRAIFGRDKETPFFHRYLDSAFKILLERRSNLGAQVRLVTVDKWYRRQRRSDS
jgi:hypothetical protein